MGDWKGVRTDLRRRDDTTIELYNLAADPAELHDISADHPEVLDRVERLMTEAREPSALFPIPVLDDR